MSHRDKLTIAGQIEHMKERGIAFDIINEERATRYLEENNNYFKLRAYRKNYDKNGENKYVGLDFAYLRDIAIIDMRLRYVLLKMCLDIEHSARVKLIRAIVDRPDEDGYRVVSEFKAENEALYAETLERASKSIYCEELQKKYSQDMPVWVLVEMMQFATLCSFYRFVANRLGDKKMIQDYYMFQEIRQLRNACAHSNCILNDLRSVRPAKHRPDQRMLNELSRISTVSRDVRQRKMSNDRIRQITTLLYCYKGYVESQGLRRYQSKELREVMFRRFNEHEEYYRTSEPILSTFVFFQKVVDNWYPDEV
ncbi:MAG: Abi family protein [Clostridia bacterium]|nr:Abi family protein [Clostridia bacterium]